MFYFERFARAYVSGFSPSSLHVKVVQLTDINDYGLPRTVLELRQRLTAFFD